MRVHASKGSRDLTILQVDEASGQAADDIVRQATVDPPDIVLINTGAIDDALLERLGAVAVVAFTRELHSKLRAELEDTKLKLEERKLVERAKGILMKQRESSEEEAFALLRSLAMQRGIRLGEAARQVIDVASLLG